MSKVSRARKGSLIVPDGRTDYSGGNKDNLVFDALYLGERAVSQQSGVEVVQDVVDQMEDYDVLGSKKLSAQEGAQIAQEQGVAMVVSSQACVTVHKARKEVLSRDFINNITFFTIIPSEGLYETVAYITRNIRLNVMRCHVFTVLSGLGQEIGGAMAKAQVAYAKVAEETLGNPFAGHGKREAASKKLYRKQIHRADLKALEVIGAGQFGAVYLATQRIKKREKGVPPEQWKATTVTRAVKMLKGEATPAAKQEFIKESEVMLDFDHPNVTNIVGVAIQQAPWLVVLEYCMYGDVRAVLKGLIQKRIKLSPGEHLMMCHGVCKGMAHIAELRLIHIDLAARNLLLGDNNLIKVADFGLTRKLDDGKEHLVIREKNIKLAIKWMSPEILKERKFSEQSDIWAAGITMWEILTYGELPYKSMNNSETQKAVVGGFRLPQPPGSIDSFWNVIETTWAAKPSERGTFSMLEDKVGNLAKRNKPPQQRDIGAILTDPAVEKQAREMAKRAELDRKKKADEVRRQRAKLTHEIMELQSDWYHPNIPKKIADKTVVGSPLGSYLVREENPKEKLLLVVNEHGEATSFSIKMEPSSSRAGEYKYIFAGRPHTTIAAIIANLKTTPFKGRSGKQVRLSRPAEVKLKGKKPAGGLKGTLSKAPAAKAGGKKQNPLFEG